VDGLAAGRELDAAIPVHTDPALHEIRVVIDEEETVRDADRDNNAVTKTCSFP
jgi:subtilase family serine protease